MKKKMGFRGVIFTVLAALMAFTLWVPACAVPPSISSDYYILMDASTGQVLCEKNSTVQLAPAGLVKILTALVASENISDPTAKLSVTSSALTPLGTGVKNIGLTSGELISAADCLYAMLMTSANDAANVVAESVGTTLDGFMTMLRSRASDLGATSTVLQNPNGLSADGQVSSARDIALFTRAALASPSFMQYFGKVSYTLEPTNKRTDSKSITTSFLMLRDSDYRYDGVIGGMTGYTSASQFVIMATAERDGRQLIAVVMKAETEANLYADTAKLFDYGFSDFTMHSVSAGDLSTIDLMQDGTVVGSMTLYLEDPVSFLLRSDLVGASCFASPNGVPTAVQVGSEATYTANIYCTDPNDSTQTVILLENVALKTRIDSEIPSGNDPTATDPSGNSSTTPTPSFSQVTDENGAFVTDENGNIVTVTYASASSGKSGSGIGRFFKSFFLVLLILIAVVIGLLLLFIAFLFILREVKRAKRRKAREQARMQQRYRQD